MNKINHWQIQIADEYGNSVPTDKYPSQVVCIDWKV